MPKNRSTVVGRQAAYEDMRMELKRVPELSDDALVSRISELIASSYMRGKKTREQMILTLVDLLASRILDA